MIYISDDLCTIWADRMRDASRSTYLAFGSDRDEYAVVYIWAVNADGLVHESNYYSIIDDIEEFDSGDDLLSDSKIDSNIGPIEILYVKISDGEGYTAAWRKACEILEALREPDAILDVTDLEQRMVESRELQVLNLILAHASGLPYELDIDRTEAAVLASVRLSGEVPLTDDDIEAVGRFLASHPPLIVG